jgi:HAD superfamily hydrolase (TIGR01549 family)
MARAIIFDFWGTLVENGIHPSPVNQVKYILRVRMSFREFVVRFEEAMMTKEYADLNEAFEAVCKEFNVRPQSFVMEKLVGMWNKNEMLGKPFFETVEMLQYLKDAGFKLGLISNTNPTIQRVLEKYDLLKYFDEAVFSYKEGILKTDPDLFNRLIERMQVSKEDVVMIGDSIQTDILGANAANVRAILIDRMNKRDFNPKIRNLRDLKGLIENDQLDELANTKPTQLAEREE